MSLVYICVPKTTIIRITVPVIWSETEFFVILGKLKKWPFTPLTTCKIQIFEKMKKLSGDVIISHLCTKNYDHMMYAYSDMECDRHDFLSWSCL